MPDVNLNISFETNASENIFRDNLTIIKIIIDRLNSQNSFYAFNGVFQFCLEIISDND